MRSGVISAAVACLLPLLSACGTSSPAGGDADAGGPTGSLDCAWASANNCWKSTIAAAAGCLPPSTGVGTLSADSRTCTYPDGHTITFDTPVIVQGQLIVRSFTVMSGGTRCLRVDQANDGFTLTTSAGSVTLSEDSGQTTLTVTCPDGTTYSGPTSTASTCKELPGRSEAGSNTEDTLTLDGTSDPQGTQVFDCRAP